MFCADFSAFGQFFLQATPSEKNSRHKAVKIAVLDTGMRKDLHEYYTEYPCPFEYADFVNATGTDLERDTTSNDTEHGSAAVLLLEKMCPDANYYVARVLQTNFATEEDVKSVVKGIEWAMLHKVDIITMAIGFKNRQGSVVDAVDRAHKERILIFSPVSNNRNLDNVYCPANETDKVFGIFSTDAGIRESASLNHAPSLPQCFAVFGEDVEVEEGRPLRRGTSYSTSIAAGLAAALLDFSRQDRVKDDGSILSRLGRQRHMRDLFELMANRSKPYSCLRPWSLLNEDYNEPAREEQRNWIRGSIARLPA